MDRISTSLIYGCVFDGNERNNNIYITHSKENQFNEQLCFSELRKNIVLVYFSISKVNDSRQKQIK